MEPQPRWRIVQSLLLEGLLKVSATLFCSSQYYVWTDILLFFVYIRRKFLFLGFPLTHPTFCWSKCSLLLGLESSNIFAFFADVSVVFACFMNAYPTIVFQPPTQFIELFFCQFDCLLFSSSVLLVFDFTQLPNLFSIKHI